MIKDGQWKFIWITHFPLFEYKEDIGGWSPMHHIFSMPHEDKMDFLESDPGKVTGKLYAVATQSSLNPIK